MHTLNPLHLLIVFLVSTQVEPITAIMFAYELVWAKVIKASVCKSIAYK
jgi:hypothetical protein